MKLLFIIIPLLGMMSHAHAQKYRLASCEVSFYSEAPLEDIKAVTVEAQSAFDAGSGEVAFLIPIRGFQFEKSLMQEHFNENYLESEKYPNATFEGQLEGFKPEVNAEQSVTAKGDLTIHGVTHSVEVPGTIKSNNGSWEMHASFPVKVADYEIDIPKVVFYNIAEVVDVTVQFTYQADAQP